VGQHDAAGGVAVQIARVGGGCGGCVLQRVHVGGSMKLQFGAVTIESDDRAQVYRAAIGMLSRGVPPWAVEPSLGDMSTEVINQSGNLSLRGGFTLLAKGQQELLEKIQQLELQIQKKIN